MKRLLQVAKVQSPERLSDSGLSGILPSVYMYLSNSAAPPRLFSASATLQSVPQRLCSASATGTPAAATRSAPGANAERALGALGLGLGFGFGFEFGFGLGV